MIAIPVLFADAEAARKFIERRRWPKGATCPYCESRRANPRAASFYHCNDCAKDYSVCTETPFARSKVPLNKWLVALQHAIQAERVSSLDLSREIEVTQKTAWLMLKRITGIIADEKIEWLRAMKPREQITAAIDAAVMRSRR